MSSSLVGRRILVVDDNETNLKLFRLTLSKAGAEVQTAANGKLAVEAVDGSPFDLVIMDMQMPVMDGFTATRLLRERGTTQPVLAVTAMSANVDRDNCFSAGCTAFLAKPVELDTLVRTVARLCDSHSPVEQRAAALTSPQLAPVDESVAEDDDPELRAIADDWLSEVPAQIEQMQTALREADVSSLARTAHKIRGTSGTLGLPQLVDPATRLEEEALAGRLQAAAPALAQLVQLVDEVSQQRAIRPKRTAAVDSSRSGWYRCADAECPNRHASRVDATAAPCAQGSYKCEMLGCPGHGKPGDRCRGIFL